jgi:hypothetical protein
MKETWSRKSRVILPLSGGNKCFANYLLSLWVLVYCETIKFWTFIKRFLYRCSDNLLPDGTAQYIFSAKYFLPFYEISKVSSQIQT